MNTRGPELDLETCFLKKGKNFLILKILLIVHVLGEILYCVEGNDGLVVPVQGGEPLGAPDIHLSN